VAEGQRGQRLRRAYARRETGELDDAAYAEIARDYVAEIVREQEDAGVEVVTNGQVHWYDCVSHLVAKLEGIEIDGLLRFFDTNYLVRQPEVVGQVGGAFGLADDYQYLAGQTKGTPKAVITGPYTLARHSILKTNGGLPGVVAAYTDVLKREIADLAAAGAPLIQIEEPSLLRRPEDAELVRNSLAKAVEDKGDAKISLVTYFGDASAIYGELVRMPVDMLGFDLLYSPGLVDHIVADPPDRPLALGAVDGRNTKLDDTGAVARTVGTIMEALAARGVGEVHLQPSCGLEYLPRDRALRKLERMREIADAVSKVGAS
jgi:5-methyltetrahydropteroyltriglutamate--homocysteine methyltransferase